MAHQTSCVRSAADREALIVSNLPLVKYFAGILHERLPRCVGIDDLIGAGYVGLIEAVDRFNDAAGVPFSAFARNRIRGAMLDFLREQDPVGRVQRTKLTLSGEVGPVHVPVSSDEHFQIAAPPIDIDNQIEIKCRLGLVRNAFRDLTVTQQDILTSLFETELSGKEIASKLGIKEERVWHLRRTALMKLRKALMQSQGLAYPAAV